MRERACHEIAGPLYIYANIFHNVGGMFIVNASNQMFWLAVRFHSFFQL